MKIENLLNEIEKKEKTTHENGNREEKKMVLTPNKSKLSVSGRSGSAQLSLSLVCALGWLFGDY